MPPDPKRASALEDGTVYVVVDIASAQKEVSGRLRKLPGRLDLSRQLDNYLKGQDRPGVYIGDRYFHPTVL
ncbi:MAG: hypothetical protein P4M13_11950 [Alphaproteobacteria bacterium]|nr:hypothetical protein [Alphaproteobacteria bacterium]